MKKPTQCVLWNKPKLVREGLMKDRFELLDTYVEESHWWRYLLKCRECGQLYFYEFYEETDWAKGNDPQYCTYVPVGTEAEVEALKNSDVWSIHTFAPRLLVDWPREAKQHKIHWVGKA